MGALGKQMSDPCGKFCFSALPKDDKPFKLHGEVCRGGDVKANIYIRLRSLNMARFNVQRLSVAQRTRAHLPAL